MSNSTIRRIEYEKASCKLVFLKEIVAESEEISKVLIDKNWRKIVKHSISIPDEIKERAMRYPKSRLDLLVIFKIHSAGAMYFFKYFILLNVKNSFEQFAKTIIAQKN